MDVKQASVNDYKSIKDFIKKKWSKDHILTKNKKLFYYFYVKKKKINFLILKKKNKIISLLGYIVNHYKNRHYTWLALWVSNYNDPFSGVRLLKELEVKFQQKILVLGLSDYAKQILKQLNYKIKTMNQYYFINEKISKFEIIQNPMNNKKKKSKNNQIFFEEIKKKYLYKYQKIICSRNYRDFEDFKFKYIANRFYKYKYYLINNNKRSLLLVTRTILVKKNSKKIIRVIDAFGSYNLFSYASNLFKYLLKNFEVEYIDLLNYGIPSKFFTNCGMNKINCNKTIVPNFFEPFIKKNKAIYFAHHKKIKKKIIIFKGDGDQERPNLI